MCGRLRSAAYTSRTPAARRRSAPQLPRGSRAKLSCGGEGERHGVAAEATSTTSAGSPTPTTWSSWSSPPRSMTRRQLPSTAPAAGNGTSRNAWRPPPASRWPGSPGSTGPTPATTCATLFCGRRCARPAAAAPARYGIAEPVACHLPPHLTVCRRHRLRVGPSARTHAGQLDVSQLPEIHRAQRRHLAQLRHHPWWLVDTAISDATHTIHRTFRSGAWTPQQRQRLRQLSPGRARRPAQLARQRPQPPRHRDRHIPRRRQACRAQPPSALPECGSPMTQHRSS